MLLRPLRRHARNGIEIIQVHQAGCGLVVIATHEMISQGAGAIDYLVRIGAVAHDVPQIKDEIMGGSRRQTSLQGLKVAVNVAEKKYLHISPANWRL